MFICIVIIALLLPGCWDRQEVEERALVTGLALDVTQGVEEQDSIQLTVLVPIYRFLGTGPQRPAAPQQQTDQEFAAQSQTLDGAQEAIQFKLNRPIFWGHFQLALISEDLARRDLFEVLDFMQRNPQFNRTFRLLITRGEARSVFNVQVGPDRLQSDALIELVANNDEKAVFPVDFHLLLAELSTESVAFIPILRPEADSYILDGTAVIRAERDDKVKMIGELDREQTRGTLALRRMLEGGTLEVPCPGNRGTKTPVSILRAQRDLNVSFEQGRPAFQVTVRLQARVVESRCDEKITSDFVEALNEVTAQTLRNQTQATVTHAQSKLRTDIFGFGEYLRRHHHDYWRSVKTRWHEIFPEVPVDVTVKADINRLGLIIK